MDHSSRLVRVVLDVVSLDASLSFYRGLLGLPLTAHEQEMATLDLGGCDLLLHRRDTASTGAGAGAAICVRAARLRELVADWRSAGGGVIDEPERQPWGEVMAVVRDPDGHIVCLVEAEVVDEAGAAAAGPATKPSED